MNAVAEQSPRWSKRRWLVTITLLALGQAVFVFALSQRALPPPRKAASQPDMRVLEPTGRRAATALPATDPTLFALVNRRGFSGPGWMRFDFAAHELRDWQDEPRWLALEPERFGAEFRKLAAASGADRLTLQDKPPPRDSAPVVAAPTVRARTVWQLSGELHARPVLSPPDLPAWPHTDVLGPTVLQLAVNAFGDVLSARVLRGSGLATADTFARETFERARFQPLPRPAATNVPTPATVTLGTVTVAWVTREPDGNGTPPAAP